MRQPNGNAPQTSECLNCKSQLQNAVSLSSEVLPRPLSHVPVGSSLPINLPASPLPFDDHSLFLLFSRNKCFFGEVSIENLSYLIDLFCKRPTNH